MMRRNLRLILTSSGILGGLSLTFFTDISHLGLLADHWSGTPLLLLGGALIGGLVGFLLFPLVSWMEVLLAKASVMDILFGSIGLIVGLFIAMLLGVILRQVPLVGPLISLLMAVVFSYLGITISTRKREEATTLFAGFGGRTKVVQREKEKPGAGGYPKVLDTSVIIDGRIADIVKTGFLEGPLIVPAFVLEELQHIADSSDVLKRNRGRRGLDILNQIQRELAAEVRISEEEVGEGLEVDSKLLKLAKHLGGAVVTNDFNLNKVAELQGVPVLNINDLANAVKPAVLPGEEMMITVMKDGKEVGQGVAYLDDGTMIVVDGGKRHIGDKIGVVVTSVLQTAAGRMIFAKPKVHAERVAP
jgi:uncharacterized protein YacL